MKELVVMDVGSVWDVSPGDVVKLRLTDEAQARNPNVGVVTGVVAEVLPYFQGTCGWRFTDGYGYTCGGYEPWVFVSAERVES